MGWNTTVIVLNDSLGAIEEDPDFGKNLARACMTVNNQKKAVDVSALGHVNAASVIETHHADDTAVVAIGGNYGTCLGYTYGWNHHEKENQIRILKDIAAKFGYNLVKKPERVILKDC